MMVFNEHDDEVFGDDSDYIPRAVHHREGRKARLEQFSQVCHCDNTLNSGRTVGHNLESCRVPLAFRAVISQQWDLLGSKGALIQ